MSLPQLFGALTAEEESRLSTCLEPVTFAKDATLFDAGAEGDSVYLLDEGEVRIEMDRPELDSDPVLRFLGPGSVIGELALLDQLPRSASAVAHSAVKARRMTARALEELSERDPKLMLKVMRMLARDTASKLRHTTSQLSEFMFGDAPDPEVDEMVGRAAKAQLELAGWGEERVNRLLGALTEVFVAQAEPLAAAAVAETHLGNVPDKTTKNKVASFVVYQSLVGKVGTGMVTEHGAIKVTELASPVGVVFGLVPMTNPVATAYFKTLITLKSRNALILSFHHSALGVGNQVGALIQGVLTAQGAPADLVQWVKQRSNRKKTLQFMGHPGVGLILATGGAAMVKAAYSSGKPALGVGPGNAPCWVCADADPDQAAAAIVLSKSFDNGLICGAEHNLVVDQAVRAKLDAALERAGAAVLTDDEVARFSKAAIDPATSGFRAQMVGQAAALIAKVAGIARPFPIRLIVAPIAWSGERTPWAGEKMAPILSLMTVAGEEEGLALCRRLLLYMGTGHTAIIHSRDEGRIGRFGAAMPASRILVNSPGAQGVVGVTSGLEPSLTLGCGTFGGNSTTDNVTFRNLYNVKRVARFLHRDLPGAPGAG